MKKTRILTAIAAASALLLSHPALALPNTQDTRMLSEPAVSSRHIAFIYAGDVWLSNLDGGGARRLTSDLGYKSNPVFSPDGSLIAYSASIDGNVDVYVIAAAGGVPRRLTFHPGVDLAQSFTPDGQAVMFTSPRAAFNNRFQKLLTVPVAGGVETQLEIPNASRATYSPDGKRIAYNPLAPAFKQWKRYRGGTNSWLWLFSSSDKSIEKIPQPTTRSNDVDPMWLGDTVYFRSDRNGEFNLFAYDVKTKAVRQLTQHADFPVLNASAANGTIVYEQAGYLHAFDIASGQAHKLSIGVASDLGQTRPRWVKNAKYIRDASISPSGARIAFEYRGEIVTIPADKGDVRNLTQTAGAHERTPIWSPDGRSVAYFSDESGEYELHVRSQDGKGAVKKLKLNGSGFYDNAVWSPDSKKIAFADNGWSMYVIDVGNGKVQRIATEPMYGVDKSMRAAWAPDSRWLAYTLNSPTYTRSAYIYSVEQNKSMPVTDGLSDVAQPVFDKSGKYLYFFASTNAGPSNNWFSQQNEDNLVTRTVWMAVLRRDLPSPLIKESDEEKAAGADAKIDTARAEPEAKNEPKVDPKTGRDDPKVTVAPVAPIHIDFDGIATRIVDLPLPAAQFSSLTAGSAGQIFLLRESDGKKAVQRFDLKQRKAETVVAEADDFEVSADGKKLLYRHKDNWAMGSATGKLLAPGEGKIKVDAIEVKADPRAEWTQIFNEVWRINRDYFYDPGMHGVDWKAMRDKYAVFLPELSSRADLNRLIQWMCSELAVGHHRGGGGDDFIGAKKVPGGLLGADYEVSNGRYRFKKVYGGLNWNPALRAPLTEPGLNVKAGEYLLAVDSRPLAPPTNLYSAFDNTAGKAIDLTVGPSADGKGARTITVVPVPNEDALRNRDWIEGNMSKVNAASNGKIAYVYVPNTAGLGHTYFKRYFFPQADKQAIIVDERFNGGGSVADYYIEILQKKEIAWWTMRYGADMKTPSASIQGPRAMLIDETAGSGGDLLPWMFRKNKLGPLIGKATWGGLVGVLGFPVLMDGGFITAPNLAFWTRENGWGVENEGVPPDIEVEQTPADIIAGRDPQLEKAIEVIQAELARNPPVRPARPAFPDKSK
ncbi:S41 family peptidase [Janthinobacterium sp. UMAB-56]|uniref:S41 family peptidase n=1 Tax=Janthinobacterium sp. UMAB-56 TaxID=1365361 RepID=UPI001C582A9B|nr:S41 family peptidase [Janthinobacterium sp. UMAB-56]